MRNDGITPKSPPPTPAPADAAAAARRAGAATTTTGTTPTRTEQDLQRAREAMTGEPEHPKFAPQQDGKPEPIHPKVVGSPPFVPQTHNFTQPSATEMATNAVERTTDDVLSANRDPDDPNRIIPKPMSPEQGEPKAGEPGATPTPPGPGQPGFTGDTGKQQKSGEQQSGERKDDDKR